MITLHTDSCPDCDQGLVEQGLQLHLVGKYGAECSTSGLDNEHLHDYVQHHHAVFHSGSPDAGLGECNNVRYLNFK